MLPNGLFDGVVFLYRAERRRWFPLVRKRRVGRIIKLDTSRGVAHIRTYVGGDGEPSIEIMHLPIEIDTLLHSIVKLIGIQPASSEMEADDAIADWEAQYDSGFAGRFVDSVYSAETDAILAIGDQPSGSIIVTARPMRSPAGKFTVVQAVLGMRV